MGKRTDGLGALTDGPIEFRHIETKMMGSNQMEMLQGQLEMYQWSTEKVRTGCVDVRINSIRVY